MIMNLSVHRHKTLRVKNKFKKRGGEEIKNCFYKIYEYAPSTKTRSSFVPVFCCPDEIVLQSDILLSKSRPAEYSNQSETKRQRRYRKKRMVTMMVKNTNGVRGKLIMQTCYIRILDTKISMHCLVITNNRKEHRHVKCMTRKSHGIR